MSSFGRLVEYIDIPIIKEAVEKDAKSGGPMKALIYATGVFVHAKKSKKDFNPTFIEEIQNNPPTSDDMDAIRKQRRHDCEYHPEVHFDPPKKTPTSM